MHDLLFNGPAVSEENSLVNRARLLALEPLAFKECLQDVATVRQVKQDIKTGRRLGVNVTPTFFVGTVARDGSIEVLRRITGAAEYRQFERAVTDLGALVVLAGSRAPK
jgi:protein-disulfide isomerase